MALLQILALLLLIATVVAFLARSRSKAEPKTPGTNPGLGDQLIDVTYGAGGGHGSVIRVTRDPQQYAKAMAPA